jgi:hypothetical protein
LQEERLSIISEKGEIRFFIFVEHVQPILEIPDNSQECFFIPRIEEKTITKSKQ